MYLLHYCVDNASLAVRITLNELGVTYRDKLLNREAGEQDSPAYRALQPLGLIPALETPDGPMFETAAILLWLADRHGALAPAPMSHERAAFLKWFFFTTSHLHPVALQIIYPEKFAGTPEAEPAFIRLALARARLAFAELEKVASSRPAWLSPEVPSILGYYIAMLARWLKYNKPGDARHIDFAAYPALNRLAAGLEARPAALKAAEQEGLGATIFTSPDY
ncbi:MAG: glutathione S-transferase family protein [Rhodobacteraceae bacterium]|nr:glutathione S-transferase family protein [Paracoccaceae bacterium]